MGHPEIKDFVESRYFHVDDSGVGVVFRAHCGGDTTKGSSYPRCELREMTESGTKRASWSTGDSQVHSMTMKVAITATPAVKKHVVCAQIHDANDDLMMVRLEGSKLFVERNAIADVMLDRKYELGSPFEIKIQAGAGRVMLWHEGRLKMNWKVSRTRCYFKAGCYTQSNPSKGDKADSFGEVVIYDLKLAQEDNLPAKD